MSERRRSAPRLAAILPGLPQLLTGRTRAGVTLVGVALALLLITLLSRQRILHTLRSGGPEDWLALATLFLSLGATWILGARTAAAERGSAPAGRSQWAMAWSEYNRSRLAVLGLYLMVGLYLLTFLAPLLTPYDPSAIGDIAATRHLPPSLAHPMGTDEFGRDVLTRVLYGARVSLSIGFVAVGISITLGTFIGAVSGYAGGLVDTLSMRFVDLLISFPRLVLLITIIALFEPSVRVVVVVLGLTLWPSTARIVRGEVLSARERDYVQAARALGFGPSRIIFRHIVPNVLGPVIVAATLGLGNIILIEAALSFLGMSVQPPTPSWGSMINDGRDYLAQAWWVATFPGLAIVMTVVAFNLIGDGLRDALDPRRVR